jgi:hypothetical protein
MRYSGFRIMTRRVMPLIAVICLTLLGACQQGPAARVKVLIGATVIPEAGAPSIDDAIIVISGTKITAVGARKDVPVPQASDRTDLSGKWIVPAQGYFITPRENANLIILEHAPNGIRPAAEADVSARIVAGEWQLH